jgi:GNAT superfamily N-acetyltransferase
MPRLDVDLNPSQTDIDTRDRLLESFNDPFIGPDGYQKLAAFIRDDDGTIVGGLTGVTYWRWLYIANLWLHECLRGQQWGSRLMTTAEEEARKRGCTRAHGDTLGFQALGFYQKLGYTLFGQIDDFAGGYARYYLQKVL